MSTYERQYKRACKKTHTQSALLFVVVNMTTLLLLLLLLVLPPICHYKEVPGCDTEKQKRHPGGCVFSPGWPVERGPGRGLVSETKMSKSCDSHEHGSTQRQQASREAAVAQRAYSSRLCVCVLLTFSGSQRVCCSRAPACTLSSMMNLCTQGQRKCTRKSTITIWLHNKRYGNCDYTMCVHTR